MKVPFAEEVRQAVLGVVALQMTSGLDAEQLRQVAERIGKEHIIPGVDCGFSTSGGLENYHLDKASARDKMAAHVGGARRALH